MLMCCHLGQLGAEASPELGRKNLSLYFGLYDTLHETESETMLGIHSSNAFFSVAPSWERIGFRYSSLNVARSSGLPIQSFMLGITSMT